jgi:hypothetical protein
MDKKQLKPITNQQSSGWHLRKFTEFVEYKEAAGEPSPHLRTVVYLSKNLDWCEKIWRLGCYTVPYSVLSAEILWQYWPYKKACNTKALEGWLTKHWGHFHIRTERRCVRSLTNFTESLLGYHHWINNNLKPALQTLNQKSPEFYEQIWEITNQVPFFGRYIVIRAIEGLRRLGIADARLTDIRAIGGHSPVRALTLFYPAHTNSLLSMDESVVNACGERLIKEAKPRIPHWDHYTCAAMLCEYRKAFEDGHEYAARTQDAEIGHYNKFIPYWENLGFRSEIPQARSKIFNHLCLGEKQGWTDVRKELENTLLKHGYNWSDTIYDYHTTCLKRRFKNPILHCRKREI